MSKNLKYNIYSEYLKNKYGTKVYKLPINISATCPNRDGNIAFGGCIFCGEDGAGYENLSNQIPVSEQIEKNKKFIRGKYKAEKFIAYFQNFSNTYIPFRQFKENILEACREDIVEISISTRPDCISNIYLEFLRDVVKEKGINISFELGLQTANYHTLDKLNRGHGLAEFIDSVTRIKKYNFEICAHVILDLPWDTERDVIENAKILSALKVNQVKIHSLYVVNGSILERMYKNKEIMLISKEEYINRVITFLEYLDPAIAVQRLIGRAPEKNTTLVNWNTSWWKIKDEIVELLDKKGSFQGKKFNYLDGKILSNLI